MLHFLKDFNAKEQLLGLVQLKGEKTPVLDLFKSNGEKLLAKKVSHYEKFHVLEDGTLAGALNDKDLTLTVNPELASFLSEGHLISIGDEYLSVVSTDPSANTVTVKARGYGDSPVTAHKAEDVVYVIAKMEGEGIITEDYKKTISKEIENYLQENTKSVHLTQQAIDLSQKDAVQLEAEETIAKVNEQAQELERSILYGKGFVDAEGNRSSFSGLKDLMQKYSGNILDAQKNLTDDALDLFIANLVNKGSTVNTFIINPLALNKVFKKMQNVVTINPQDQAKQVAGGVLVGYLPSTMGGQQINFVTSKACRPTDMFVVDDAKLNFIPRTNKTTGQDWVFTITPETNSSSAVVNKTIRTSGTIKVEDISTMGYIVNVF